MKKILILLGLLVCFSGLSQNPDYHRFGARTPFIKWVSYTTAQRDALSLSSTDRTVIHHLNVSPAVNQFEQWDGDSWEVLGSGTGATNLSTTQTATTVTINSDTGTDAIIPLGDGTDAGASINNYTTTEKNKLAGIESGATANSSDATLLNRANHTGTQTASTISDFDTEVSNNTSVVANTAKVSFQEAPNDGQEYVRKNEAWAVATGGGGGSSTFTGLTDTPSSYTGQAGRFTKVNTGETSLEFTDDLIKTYSDSPLKPVFWAGTQAEHDAKFGAGYTHPDTDFIIITDAEVPALTASDIENVPSGNLEATNVQAALNELQTDINGINTNYISSSRTLTINGVGYDLSANRSWTINDISGNAATATTLQTARTINGTSFDGTANITTANWGTSRNLSIGGTSKAVNGSANVTWSTTEIGITKTNIDALGIDAATLDGIDSGDFARMDFTNSGNFTVTGAGNFSSNVSMGTNSRTVGTGTGTANTSYFSFYESNNSVRQGYIGFASSSNSDLTIRNDTNAKVLTLEDSGELSYNGDGSFAGDVTVPDEAYGAGWNGSTEVPTKNAVYDKIETLGGADYLVYTALLNQTGTSNPTAIVLQNTTGGTISWTRNSAGNYTGTITGATFTLDKTAVFITKGGGIVGTIKGYRLTDTEIIVAQHLLTTDSASDTMSNECIEIRIYP